MFGRQMRDSYDPFECFYIDTSSFSSPRNVLRDYMQPRHYDYPLAQNYRGRLAPKYVEKFEVMMNVKHFKPEEIDIKTVDNFVIIHGKHEEQADEHGFVTREFTRRYKLPEDVEPDTVTSSLSQDGILRIQAPRKQLEPPPKNERVIPIKIQRTAANEMNEMLEDMKKNETQQQASSTQTSQEPKE